MDRSVERQRLQAWEGDSFLASQKALYVETLCVRTLLKLSCDEGSVSTASVKSPKEILSDRPAVASTCGGGQEPGETPGAASGLGQSCSGSSDMKRGVAHATRRTRGSCQKPAIPDIPPRAGPRRAGFSEQRPEKRNFYKNPPTLTTSGLFLAPEIFRLRQIR